MEEILHCTTLSPINGKNLWQLRGDKWRKISCINSKSETPKRPKSSNLQQVVFPKTREHPQSKPGALYGFKGFAGPGFGV